MCCWVHTCMYGGGGVCCGPWRLVRFLLAKKLGCADRFEASRLVNSIFMLEYYKGKNCGVDCRQSIRSHARLLIASWRGATYIIQVRIVEVIHKTSLGLSLW